MFTFKPKKVFEKLNKMDRKQAYTIGAIAVVSVVALLMLVSAVSSPDDSFDGMATRGYDLANMPFATDAAEQYLLADKYSDMRENGSTLLYSAAEKEARQEEDAQAFEEEQGSSDDFTYENSSYEDNTSAARSDNGGYSDYPGGSGVGGSGRGGTQVGQLATAGMAAAGGNTSGSSMEYHKVDSRIMKHRDKGEAVTSPLVIGQRREAAAFRTASAQAARGRNQMTAARKAVQQLSVDGQNPVASGPVIDPTGGFKIEDGAPPSSADLANLDDKVAEAAKKAEEKKKEEEKLGFWEQLGQDLLRQAASSLVDSIMGGLGDSLRGQRAYYSARRQASNEISAAVKGGMSYDDASKKYGLTQDQYNTYKNKKPGAAYRSVGKGISYNQVQGQNARTTQIGAGSATQTGTGTGTGK